MVKTVLHKKLLRDMRHSAMQFIALMVLCVLGVFLFSGIDTLALMTQATNETYFERNNLADFWITLASADRDALSKVRAIPGVEQAQARFSLDMETDLPGDATLNVTAYDGEMLINTPVVLAGEARGQTMQQVIGLDYRTFCDEIVAAVPRRPRGVRMLSAVDDMLPAVTLLLAIWTAQKILSALLTGQPVLWLTLTVGEGISLACLVTWVCRTALRRPPVGAEEGPGGLWKVFLLALVVFAALFLPRVILPQPLVTLWMPAAVVVTLLPLLVSALLDRRTDL